MMKNNPKNILITGGLGYIGSHTVLELFSQDYLNSIDVKENYNIEILDNCSNSTEKVLDIIKEITGKSPKSCDHPFCWKKISSRKPKRPSIIL
jgi:UDP-glucose 4-epimerase